MKIAMIGQKGIAPDAGGIERHVEEIGARLAARGHRVDVYARRHYTRCGAVHRGMNVRLRPAIHTKHLDAISHTVVSTLDALPRGYDILHYHALGPTTLAPVARLSGARVVSTCHGLDWRREKWGRLASAMLRAAEWPTAHATHRLVTVSRELATYFQERHGVRAVPIPNGVDVPERLVEPRVIRERWGLTGPDGEGAFVLFMARLVPEKSAHDLIDAFRRIDASVRLVIAGGASHSDHYEKSLQERAKGDARIVFTGSVSGDAWSELMSNARLFVLPSSLEGLPIVLLEAMAHARICLASDIPENREVVEPVGGEAFGKLFPQGDVDALARAITREIGGGYDPRRGEDAREMVRRCFGWDEVTDRLEAVYRDCLGLPERERSA